MKKLFLSVFCILWLSLLETWAVIDHLPYEALFNQTNGLNDWSYEGEENYILEDNLVIPCNTTLTSPDINFPENIENTYLEIEAMVLDKARLPIFGSPRYDFTFCGVTTDGTEIQVTTPVASAIIFRSYSRSTFDTLRLDWKKLFGRTDIKKLKFIGGTHGTVLRKVAFAVYQPSYISTLPYEVTFNSSNGLNNWAIDQIVEDGIFVLDDSLVIPGSARLLSPEITYGESNQNLCLEIEGSGFPKTPGRFEEKEPFIIYLADGSEKVVSFHDSILIASYSTDAYFLIKLDVGKIAGTNAVKYIEINGNVAIHRVAIYPLEREKIVSFPYEVSFNSSVGLQGWLYNQQLQDRGLYALGDSLWLPVNTSLRSPYFNFTDEMQDFLIEIAYEGDYSKRLKCKGISGSGVVIERDFVDSLILSRSYSSGFTILRLDMKRFFGSPDIREILLYTDGVGCGVRSFKISPYTSEGIAFLPYTADFTLHDNIDGWSMGNELLSSPVFELPDLEGKTLYLEIGGEYILGNVVAILKDGSGIERELNDNPATATCYRNYNKDFSFFKVDVKQFFGSDEVVQFQFRKSVSGKDIAYFRLSAGEEFPRVVTEKSVLSPSQIHFSQVGDINWVYADGKYSLKATTQHPRTGIAILSLPRVTGVSGFYHLQGLAPDKVDLSFGSLPIESNGYSVFQQLSGSSSNVIIATLKNGFTGEVPEIIISDLYVSEKKVRHSLKKEEYYDFNGDRIMELYCDNGYNGNDLCNLFQNSYYKSGISWIWPFTKGYPDLANINNDNAVDFVWKYGDEVYTFVYTPEGDKKLYLAGGIPCDVNSDGRPDLLASSGRVYMQLYDGSFVERKLNIQSLDYYQNHGRDNSNTTGNHSFIVSDGIPDIRSQMFQRDGGKTYSNLGNVMVDIDFNHDGRPDLLNTSNGELLINLGEDQYVSIPLGGQIFFRDLNGDQKLDYIVYDNVSKVVKAVVEQPDGTVGEQVLMQNLSMDNMIWCYDFDKDGDVDILLPFSYQESNQASFLVVMENDGKGHFTMHENAFDDKYLFVDCGDLDHDGYMDILAQKGQRIVQYGSLYNSPMGSVAILLKGDKDFNFIPVPEPLVNLSENDLEIKMADLNNDGIYEIFNETAVHYLKGVTPNRPPDRPEAPKVVYEVSTGYLKISWQPGADEESSSIDLTYALRVGSAPGKGDMFYAHANADGSRRNLQDGNMGYCLDKILNVKEWNTGKYYIAIQAVDPVHNGSEWSEETVFEKNDVSTLFTVSQPQSTLDTVIVSYGSSINRNYSYRWDFDGAEICGVNADSSIFRLCWNEAGKKNISLQITDANGNVTEPRFLTVEIFPNKLVTKGITSNLGGSLKKIIDLDGDGRCEALTTNGVFENDGTGHFTKVKKIYNTNLSFEWSLITDYDCDGQAEILNMQDPNDKDITVYHNEGNNVLSINENFLLAEDINIGSNYGHYDFDNDGREYILGGNCYSIYKMEGKYPDWTSCGEAIWGNRICLARVQFWKDINNDGYLDGIAGRDEIGFFDYIYAPILYVNHGGGLNFEKVILNNPFGENVPYELKAVADFNNDGYLDMIVTQNTSIIKVCLNNENKDFNQIIEINLPEDKGESLFCGMIKDMDNNGYPDILYQNSTSRGIIYFYPDMKWKIWDYFLYSQAYPAYGGKEELFVDVNGDGTLDYIDYLGKDDNFLNLSKVTNTLPEAPANIRAVQTDTTVLIEWEAARDAESLPAQMRYNISVKKKGATGNGAFIISPLNGLNDQAAIIPSHSYRTATRMEIPLPVMPVGDYEIQIQAFDGWDAHSPFSPVYDFSVQKAVNIKLPAVACLNTAVAVRYLGTEDPASLEWDWDGGTLQRQDGDAWMVAWDTEGNKKITVRTGDVTSSASILVKTAPDLNFDINAYALENSLTPLTLPTLALDPAYTLNWKIAKDGSEDLSPAEWKDTLTIARRGVTREVQVRFMKRGDYVLSLQTTAEGCGIVEASRRVQVKGSLPVPQIGLVTVDAVTAKNKLRWSVPANLPEYAESVNIYKEGSKYNDFRLLANVPLTQTEFTDLTSSPEVTSSRYRMTLLTDWGAEGEPGTAHRSVHMMINKGMGNSWNLIWTPYEGAMVESFRILRGTSPDALEVMGEVAGSAMSWSDMTAPEGSLYYALEFDSEYDDTWTPVLRMARAATRTSVRSNVVGVVDAADAVLAESLKIRCLEEKAVLNPGQKSLHLYADVLPLSATYRRVNWQIIEGAELASVDAQGVLTVKGNAGGKVKVCALAVDGSGTSDTLEVTAERWELQISDVAVTDVIGCADSDNGELLITAKGGDGDVSYSINGGQDWYTKNHFTALAGGDYDVVVRDGAGTEVRWASNPVHVGAPDAIVIDTVKLIPVDGHTDGLTQIQVTAWGGSGYQKYYNYDSYDNWIQSASINMYPGTYHVGVKDENGCIAGYRHNPVVILVPGQLGITGVESRNVSVTGGHDGEIHITAQGGAGVLGYTINGRVDYSTSADFTGLPAGDYDVWVKDEAGTMVEYGSNPVVITEPAPEAAPVITEVIFGDISGCYGDRTGEIWVKATTVADRLEYAVNGNWQDSSHFTRLGAGSYQVAVRDGQGNEVLYSGNPVMIRQPEELTIKVDTFFISDSNGQNLTVSVFGSQGENKYSIDDGQTWQNISLFEGLFAGDYIIRVQDSKGCEASANIIMHTPVRESLEIVKVDVVAVSVYGGSDGAMTIHATGGTAPLQYSIDEGITWSDSPIFSGLKAGIYKLMVRDAGGNIAYTHETLTQPDEQVYSLEIMDFRLQAGAATTASRMVTLEQHVVGGVPFYCQACEDTLAAGANWELYSLLPVYELSAGAGTKTVFMRVRDNYGLSPWVSASIRYEEMGQLSIERVVVNEGTGYITDPHVRLIVIASGEPREMQVTLNGWNSGWTAYQMNTQYQLTEGEGDYVCRVKVRNEQGESEEVSVEFGYKKAPAKLSVEDFVLDGGSKYTHSRAVTLDHRVEGLRPVAYAVSEYADMHDARWMEYEFVPEYRLSEVAGMKTVYFAVTDGHDTSEVVTARIMLDGQEADGGFQVRIWPNPVNDVLHILLTDEEAVENTEIRVYTPMGQVVERRVYSGQEISLNTSRYPFGILFVELVNNGKKVVKQIVKK